MTVPAVSPGLVAERARALVDRGRERVVLLRSAPQWSGPPSLTVDGYTVHVRPGVSQLGVLTACVDLPDGDFLVVLTDRPERDLGDAVLTRAAGRTVERPDDWDAVAGMTGARDVDAALRRHGRWAATALLDHRPETGWPAAATDVLMADEALGWLLARVLRQPVPTEWDAVRLVEVLNTLPARSAWAATDEQLRRHLTRWAADALGSQARLALLAAQTTAVSVVALGLALDVLWPTDGTAEPDQLIARGKIETTFGGTALNPARVRALATDARDITLRMDDANDPDLPSVLAQAERVLADVRWPAGARQSDILPAGLTARLEHLAGRITAHLNGTVKIDEVEQALGSVLGHRFARPEDREVTAARMATRLVRWLALPGVHDVPADLGASLERQVTDGGWVDRAVAAIWTGSGHGAVAAAYRRLADRVVEIRDRRDRAAATQLAAATADGSLPDGVVPVERMLHDVVRPLAAAEPVLLVVLDGMSMRVATEIAQGATDKGWTELLPTGRRTRLPALAVLPSVTAFSRTSLLCGDLLVGTQSTEKSRFRDLTGGPVFHKDDLRSGAGDLLPEPVLTAIKDPKLPVVAAVLNTIDDALAKDDPDGTVWDLDRVRHLRALLNAATLAGRVVVLTADHGHVVERGGTARPTSGADARWRPPSTGPAGADEVLVRGERVLSPGGEAVLAVAEGLRYGAKTAGYHGGAALAEITVPLVVLDRALRTIKGWTAAPPQTPAWWNDPVFSAVEEKLAVHTKRTARKTPQPAEDSFDALLPELVQNTAPADAGAGSVVERLVASRVYATQRSRAGRRALGDDVVTAVLAVLVARGGRAHRETVAAAAGVAEVNLEPTLAALRRLLNVEGYQVVGEDPDGVTIVLDEKLLTEQFELRR